MAVKPIDLQTNISQMIEVGKGEHAKSGAIAEQQQLLDKESAEKSKLVDSRLEETKKGDSSIIKDEQKKKRESEQKSDKRKEKLVSEKEKKKNKKKIKIKDDKLGNIIDIFK